MPSGRALLFILAGVSTLLLVYEASTLIGSVLVPLLANPQALQTDFHYYYDAAVRFEGNPLQVYSSADDVIAGFAYPPPAILPFAWLARWPLGTALLAFTILSYLVLVASAQHWLSHLRRDGREFDRSTAIAVLLIVVASGPVYMNAIFGQVNTFVLATSVAFVTLGPRAVFEASLLLAIGAWLKVYPVVLAAIVVWDRRVWRAILGAGAAALAIGGLVALTLVPWPNFTMFFFEVLPSRADVTAIHITNQSLVAFLERFMYPSQQFLNWTGEQAVTVRLPIRIFNVIVAVAVIAWLWTRSRMADARMFNAAVVMALIAVIAPLGWGHTYVMALPLVMLQLIAMRTARPAAAVAIFCCVAALMIPPGRRFPFLEAAPDWVLNLIYSRYLLATLVLASIPSVAIGRSPNNERLSSS